MSYELHTAHVQIATLRKLIFVKINFRVDFFSQMQILSYFAWIYFRGCQISIMNDNRGEQTNFWEITEVVESVHFEKEWQV